jgi:hypothetical protein
MAFIQVDRVRRGRQASNFPVSVALVQSDGILVLVEDFEAEFFATGLGGQRVGSFQELRPETQAAVIGVRGQGVYVEGSRYFLLQFLQGRRRSGSSSRFTSLCSGSR